MYCEVLHLKVEAFARAELLGQATVCKQNQALEIQPA